MSAALNGRAGDIQECRSLYAVCRPGESLWVDFNGSLLMESQHSVGWPTRRDFPRFVITLKSGDAINFTTVACRIYSRLKWYKNYKNRLRLAKVIVKNKMSRFYGSLCTLQRTTERNYEMRAKKQLEGLGQCIPPPRHVLPVPLSGESVWATDLCPLITFRISQ